MTMTKPDRFGPTAPEDAEIDLRGHTYTWYDPDAAAFELADPPADLDPFDDEDSDLPVMLDRA